MGVKTLITKQSKGKPEEIDIMDRFGLLKTNSDRFYFIAFHLMRIEKMLSEHGMRIK